MNDFIEIFQGKLKKSCTFLNNGECGAIFVVYKCGNVDLIYRFLGGFVYFCSLIDKNVIDMITKDKFVSVSYELRTDKEGEAIEVAGVDTPLEFICGHGQTLEFFEMNLLEKKKGDHFDFKISAENAYGEVNEEMKVELPKEIFKEVEPEEMVIGNVLPMMDSVGRRLQGKIGSIGEEEVCSDFTHPLAGKDLYFSGEVVEVRDATAEEIEALHAHKCGGCSGCGSEGSCGGGCSSGCCH